MRKKKEKTMNDYKWNRCDECNKRIPLKDFESGVAYRRMVTPDSEFSQEEFETYCKDCNEEIRFK
jgi:hypothetical protein